MITLESDQMTFRFPEVHPEAQCSIEFQRTLRIPDDDRDYPLPPGLGGFPLRHLDDFADRLPRETVLRGGVVMPMHQAEALWVNFDAGWDSSYPCAVKVAAGKVCAVSGEPWSDRLAADPQNYLVVPDQPWLDGYCVEKGIIRQFVAMPLGEGYTAEEQLTGAAKHGGLQISVCPMKREIYEKLFGDRFRAEEEAARLCYGPALEQEMGLAPGGRMRQEIYDDDYGLEVVLNTGVVVDLETLIVEWYFADGFGDRLGFLDIDGDGVLELIGEVGGLRHSRYLRIFNVDIQTETFLVLPDDEARSRAEQ